MNRAQPYDKELVADILTKSFLDNRSVNYIIKQDEKREQRIKALMKYSFEKCYLFGDVFISEDKKSCALLIRPENKKLTLKSILLDINLLFSAVGILNIKKTLRREAAIKKIHPETAIYYLWFIGVHPSHQNKGIGSKILNQVTEIGLLENRTICLETSNLKNIPWYEKHGFKIYQELNFGYKLYCLKKG
jgi:ribosomal protein S18 acetylase RimI-like enzyme